MPTFKKGSKAAKDYMASIRKMKGKPKSKKTTTKKVGAIKIVEKGETKLTRPTKVYQQTRTKSGTFKSLKRIAGTTKHKDTKSHNVNIRVMSGTDIVEYSLKDAQLYTTAKGKNTKFYYNVFGWNTYFTLKPTFATPTGKAKGFPRIIIFKP